MIIYEGCKSDFLSAVDNDSIALEIENNILQKMHRTTAKNEFRSWENSLMYMYKVMNDTDIPNDTGVAIEYNIPQTSKRIDFLISGFDHHDNGNVMVIELKQWDQIELVEGKDALVRTYTGNAMRDVVHPSYQAWSYAQLIRDYNHFVEQEQIQIHPCSYLHNYIRKEKDVLDHPIYKEYLQDAPAFTKGQVDALRSFIKKHIKKGDNKEILYRIDNGKIKPSKSLQSSIQSLLKGNKEFIMIDEQKVVYEEIKKQSIEAKETNNKKVIIVKGGPGTGKSVLAINLLADLTCLDQFVQYASKNSAPRNVYNAMLKGNFKKNSIDNMFKGTGSYIDVMNNTIDTILVDEAHRLNEKSGMFKNLGENQIKEIIHAAKCSVFFIDENQKVTLSDIGNCDDIKYWAKQEHAEVIEMELISQFRCNGSDGYLAWLDNTLEIKETANYDLDGIDYDIQIIDDPSFMRKMIIEKNNENHRSRLLAGYCWDWIKEGKNDTNVYDIQLGDSFKMSWNLGNTSTFAIDDTSINEVGCIHTSQGLEFDYVGVIIGDDMRYEDGHVVTDFTKRAKTDQSLKGIKKIYEEDAKKALEESDKIIKNTYRTLMTRGMKGCYVYCTDKKLAAYLKSCLEYNSTEK